MWIDRPAKSQSFQQAIRELKNQVLIVRGARQVGKTSFIQKTLELMADCHKVRLNLSFKHPKNIGGDDYFGRDFFGYEEDAEELLKNLALTLGDLDRLTKPVVVFIDEADRHPIALEAVQTLASYSQNLKFIFTGSNLENIVLKNAATGRKRFFDLYPITFAEFLNARGKTPELVFWQEASLIKPIVSTHFHNALSEAFGIYLKLGGMPKILDTYFTQNLAGQDLPGLVADLVYSIEDNIKSVLGEKSKLYEYEDVLRKMALLSLETLKFSKLQVQHAGRSEAKKIVNKTVGARVAHKIRLFDSGEDLSKYILFDAGVLNYLLNGSDLLRQKITQSHLAIQYETAVGLEIIATLPTRDDLFYWKSKRGAQVDFLLKSPKFAGLDVKSTRGDTRSLDSCAVYEEQIDCVVKVSTQPLSLTPRHAAKIPNQNLARSLPLVTVPHYLSGRLQDLLSEL